MKRNSLLLTAIILTTLTQAQTPFEQLVNAENKFEKECLELGIKGGFLKNMDSSAIAFTKGSLEEAKKFWLSLPDFAGIYTWAPDYAEASLSGDWGYTTGAVEYRDSSINDRPSSYNQYTTVWHKNKNGEWKYLVDIGNSHGPVKIDRIAEEMKVKKVAARNLSKQTILNLEKEYFQLFQNNTAQAINKYYSKSVLFNFSGKPLTTSADSILSFYKPVASDIKFAPVDIRISPHGDMAAVSGYIIYQNQKKHYLRIWRNETVGWKIALEVAKL